MSRNLGDAFVRVRPDMTTFGPDLNKRMASAGTSAGAVAGKNSGTAYAGNFERASSSRLTTLFRRAAGVAAAAFASRKIFQGASALVDRASDLAETGNKISVVFGKADGAVQRFSGRALTKIGQTQQSALDAAATFGVFGKAAGLSARENAKFSTRLTRLSSDMASFSNTTPEQAIQAIGSALRGESEPIRQYGVLLDEATLKAEALSLGLLKPVKDQAAIKAANVAFLNAQRDYNKTSKDGTATALEKLEAESKLAVAQSRLRKATDGTIPTLTNQQKVLAAESAIMKQTADAQGDFARTSGGLANQKRILAAQGETLKTVLGKGLLPVFTSGAQILTRKVMPPLIDLAGKWVPKASRAFRGWIKDADPSAMFARVGDKLKSIPWGSFSSSSDGVGASLERIGDSLKGVDWGAVKDGINQGVVDTLSVFNVVIGFVADHIDELAKYLPALVVAFAAYRVAQAAANLAALAQVPITIAQTVSNIALARQLKAHTAQLAVNTTAENVATGSRIRGTIATVASTVASKAAAAAQKAWAAAQWLLNAAMSANPLGLAVVAIAALVAGLVIAYKKSETFRDIVDGAFKVISTGIKAYWNLWIKPAFTAFKAAITAVGKAGIWLWNNALQPAFRFILNGVAGILDVWASMLRVLGKVPGFGWAKDAAAAIDGAADKVREFSDGIKKIPETKKVQVWVETKYTYSGLKDPTRGRGDDYGPPRLATGGRASRASHVIIGDGNEPESVMPDSMLEKALARAAMAGGGMGGGRVSLTITNWRDGTGYLERVADGRIGAWEIRTETLERAAR